MKKHTLSVLTSRLSNIGFSVQDTTSLAFYTDILNKVRPDDSKEVTISWTENLLNPHPKSHFGEWHNRIELVRGWYESAQVDEIKSKDLELMLEMDLIINAIHQSCLAMVGEHAIQPTI